MPFEGRQIYPMAGGVAIAFRIAITLQGGATVRVLSNEFFTVNDDGLITAVDERWVDEDVIFV